MRAIKCPNCGGELHYEEFGSYRCNYCGSVFENAGSDLQDSDIVYLDIANERRNEYEFEKALEYCEAVLQNNPNNDEANFCAILAKYKVIYLETGAIVDGKSKFAATFLDPDTEPLTQCEYYGRLSESMRHKVEEIEQKREAVSQGYKHVKKYDIFLCYKKNRIGNAGLTEEADWAEKAYEYLTKRGFRVFYADECLEGNSEQWDIVIYAALKSSKQMFVFGSSAENLNANWVKNEWKRFTSLQSEDPRKKITLVRPAKADFFGDLDPQLSLIQAISVERDNDSWLRKIEEMVGRTVKNASSNVKDLLIQGTNYIRLKKFKRAKKTFEEIVNTKDSSCHEAYWGILKCKYKAFDDYDLVSSKKPIENCSEYKDAVSSAQDAGDAEQYEHYKRVSLDQQSHEIRGYRSHRENYTYYLKKTKVKRTFKKIAIVLLALLLGASAAFGGYSVYDIKSREYTLLFDYGDAVGDTISRKVYLGEETPDLPGDLAIAGKEYMDFVGWFTQPDCQGVQITGADGKFGIETNDMVSLSNAKHQIQLYAGFALHKYSVTFYDTEGYTVLKSVQAEHGSALEDVASEIYMGDQLAIAWSLQPGGADFNGKIESDLSLYATSFAIKVKYDSNGGNDLPDELVRVGDKIPMPTPERQYYGFAGWAYKNQVVEYGFVAPTENITLVAQWNKTHFTLTLDSNGGLADKSEIVKAGNTVSLPVLSRQYYRFLGWEYNGSIVDNSFTMPTKDILLTAKWEKTHYAVTLDGETQYIRVGESIVLPTRTRAGYIFNGWRYGNQVYQGSYVPQGDITFTADWKAEEYTVSLNTNGGVLPQSTAKVTYASVYKLPVPTRDGYEFAGWYTSTDGSGRQATNNQGASVSVWNDTSGRTLYAVWTKEYENALARASCKADNGYDPSTAGPNIDSLAHHNWDILSLVIGGCAQDADGGYFVPEGSPLSVSFKVLQNIGALPTWGMNGASVNWTNHWMSSDSYSGSVYGTNISSQTVGYGAYYVKITYTDGSYYETNKVNFMSGAKKNDVITVPLNLNINKRIKSLEVVAVYELYYDYMSDIWDWDGTKRYANWRCTGSIKFS